MFATQPDIPLDNNKAEQSLRLPVTGRKNFYGSGSRWSARLAAAILTVLQTLRLWDLNPHHWLSQWLQACADNGGKPPTDLSPFLPWAMRPARRHELAQPRPQAPTQSGAGPPVDQPEPS